MFLLLPEPGRVLELLPGRVLGLEPGRVLELLPGPGLPVLLPEQEPSELLLRCDPEICKHLPFLPQPRIFFR